jgi:hypothetical protein
VEADQGTGSETCGEEKDTGARAGTSLKPEKTKMTKAEAKREACAWVASMIEHSAEDAIEHDDEGRPRTSDDAERMSDAFDDLWREMCRRAGIKMHKVKVPRCPAKR